MGFTTSAVLADSECREYYFGWRSLSTEWVLDGESLESPAVLQIFAV